MSQHQNCPCKEECALQAALESIGGKWKMRILCSLSANGASRYNELLHNVKGISNTMLSQTLRENGTGSADHPERVSGGAGQGGI